VWVFGKMASVPVSRTDRETLDPAYLPGSAATTEACRPDNSPDVVVPERTT
jgi:hypothetical protein